MGRYFLISAFLIGFTTGAFASEPSAEDSTAVMKAFLAAESWIGHQLEFLQAAPNTAQLDSIARNISQRTDSLTQRFRKVFPDDDDGAPLSGMYSGLASAYACSAPALAAVYRASAMMALYSSDSAYRPAPYEVLCRISEHANALAHVKRPERIERLIAKLHSDHIDLVVAL
jgi:hypothetical protein